MRAGVGWLFRQPSPHPDAHYVRVDPPPPGEGWRRVCGTIMNSNFKELRLASVSRHFDNPSGQRIAALHELTLTIKRGEFICLLGPSGCGKTTALNCIAGLLPVTGGTISLDENRIDLLPPEKRGFGMVFQNYALFPHMTVRRNVAFGLRMQGVSASESAPRVAKALK